jgi:hypothetical protein
VKPTRIVWLLGATALGLSFIHPSAASPPGPKDPKADDGKAEVRELLDERAQAFPIPNSAVAAQWDAVRAAEATRWASRMPGGGQQSGGKNLVSGKDTLSPWINIGPSDVVTQDNDGKYDTFDSGRPVAIVVDPRDPDVVYNATANGGVWKTTNFISGAPSPRWSPLTDGLPNLSVGAFTLDPAHPDTLYMVTGDAFDSRAGVSVYKSTNAGGTWSAPIVLTAAYPGLDTPYRPLSARDAKVDPTNGNNILVTTEAGLFRSTDGGAKFSLVDLPNGPEQLAEAMWSVIHVGGSNWLASGVTACAALPAPGTSFSSFAYPPLAGYAMEADPTYCPLGNFGDIWRSTDGGATWTSLRTPATGASSLPMVPDGDAAVRITLAAGNTQDPAHTTVYAYVGNLEYSFKVEHRTLGFWRSRDGGLTWADATGALKNPTVTEDSCADMNLGHGQTWYNEAIAVDPTNDDNVIAGGNLCGIRTLNGTADSPTWENVSFWLNIYEGAYTAEGKLPYVHADWHGATIVTSSGKPVVLVANDGGVYSSSNVFDHRVSPVDVAWHSNNRGLVTHLAYGVGSGDPTTGNGYLAIMGLQDNGTWVRPTAENSSGFLQLFPTTFQGILGGDGIGSAVSTGKLADLWYSSVEFGYYFCDNNHTDCTQGASYVSADPPIPQGDNAPFFVYYAQVPTDDTGLTTLTSSDHRVFRTQIGNIGTPGSGPPVINAANFSWVAASPDFKAINASLSVRRPVAARFLPGVTGAVLSGYDDALPVVAVSHTGGVDPSDWTLSAPLPLKGGARLRRASYLDFPNAVSAGKSPGDEFIVASDAIYLSDGYTPVPDDMGHVFKTTDRGKTWASISGEGGSSPLPNVPVYVAKFDPSDASSQTIYVGTLIGVYVTTDGGATWARYGSGLPFVQVTDLYIAKNNDFLRISTYGRGLWEVYPSADAPRGVSGNGDYDLNQQIDWIDVAALASRIGTTPGTTAAPRYNEICDIVSPPVELNGPSPTASIKDSDLSAILSTFARQP